MSKFKLIRGKLKTSQIVEIDHLGLMLCSIKQIAFFWLTRYFTQLAIRWREDLTNYESKTKDKSVTLHSTRTIISVNCITQATKMDNKFRYKASKNEINLNQ